MANKFAKAIAEAAEQNDYNEATSGGEFTPLPEGPVRLRFVGYVELGKHETEWQGKKREQEKVRFTFEVSGPKIEPREDGQPHLISFEKNKSTGEKAAFYKLFRKMNYTGEHKVFAQMLGEAFRGSLQHSTSGEGENKRTYVNLWDADGNFTIAPPYYDDPESGERRVLNVPEAKEPLKCFLWANPDKEQWDSIFIDGEWEAKGDKPARSKNFVQEKIKKAINWIGSPMQELLFGDVDVGEAEKPARKDEDVEKVKDQKAGAADTDPLDDIPF